MPSDTTPPLSPDSTRLYSAVDRSNETYRPSPHAARRTIPSGRVSPDGKRAWPQPSLTSRILVYGGMGIVAAAATAGAVLAVRAGVDAIAGDDEDRAVEAARQRARARRTGPAGASYRTTRAGFAHMDRDAARETERRRAEQQRAERDRAARMRREAARRRASRRSPHGDGSVVESVNETVSSVTGGVRDVLATVTAAIEGFRSVASQASEVMADFNSAADQVKAMIEPAAPRRRPAPDARARPAKKDVVDLRDAEAEATDARSHRL